MTVGTVSGLYHISQYNFELIDVKANRNVFVKEMDGLSEITVSIGDKVQRKIQSLLPAKLIRELVNFPSEDVFERVENPEFYNSLVNMLTRRSISLHEKSVLDVGCRYGTSTLAVSRLEASSVIGIDTDYSPLRLGKIILSELDNNTVLRGVAKIDLVQTESNQLPFASSSFDLVLCNALFEHVANEIRANLVRNLWDLVRPGGFLIVNETPNRWWPRDGHTTGLWFIPYLPKKLAQFYAIHFCKSYTRGQITDWEFMISQGIRGVTYWNIARYAKNCDIQIDINADDITGYFDDMLQRYNSQRHRVTNWIYRTTCQCLKWLICKPLKWPSTVVTPSLFMALRKA